jgi:uncharacterized protein (TIGR00297 family)
MDYTLFIIELIFLIVFIGSVAKYQLLDRVGTLAAFLIGATVLIATDIRWFSLLFLFFTSGFIVTKVRFNEKKRKGVSENGMGMRKAKSVAANGFVPALIALFSVSLYHHRLVIPFIAAIAIASSDTFASEIGVLSNRAYLITNLKPVEAGTNGGISWLGQLSALVGAVIISVAAFFLLDISLYWMGLCILIGFIGCQIDSLLGATFQGKGKAGTSLPSNAFLSNSDVNLISIAFGTLMAFILTLAISF